MGNEKAASLLAKWGRMARFRHHERTGGALYRAALLLDPQSVVARRALDKHRPRNADDLPHLRGVILGTTGLCNASCAHCPTGKLATAHVPRTPMPMPIFRKIIDGIAEHRLDVIEHISFGLFGDGLVDPFVIERAAYVKAVLPDVMLTVNTNAAAYNPKKHAELNGLIGELSLHCESLQPETFERLMTPLRAKNVFPKYEMILRDFPRKVRVSIPVSRANLDELRTMEAWFLERGAHTVAFDALSSRCMDDRSLFDSLALNPVAGACGTEVADYLVVDSDGLVMSCCQDFERIQSIGDFATGSFAEVMRSAERAHFRKMMAEGGHGTMPACSKCAGDLPSPGFPFDRAEATLP